MLWKVFLIPTSLTISASLFADGDAKKDADRFQGNWIVVSHMNNHEKSSAENVKKLKAIIKGQTLTLSADEGIMEIGFTLDASKSPKAVDLELPEPKKHTVHGIYELQGDMLKIAWNNKGERPKTFPTKAKDGTGMIVLKRATDK